MGGGGTGKSVVSAELLRRLRARGDVGLAWHFCRHDDAAQSSAGALIRSLSAMLGAAVGDAATFREAREAAAARASDDAAALFDALVAAPLAAALGGAGVSRRVVVVVDALDELPRAEQKELLELLAAKVDALPPGCRVFATSRDEPQIKRAFGKFAPTELRVDEKRNREDVESYLRVIARTYVTGALSMNRRKAAHPARIRLSTPEAIADVDWDYCGSCVAVALKDKIRVYCAATCTPLLAFDYPCELDAAVAHVAWAPDDRALAVHDGKTLVVLSLAQEYLVSGLGGAFEVVACEVVAGDAADADMPGCVAWTSATTVVVPVVTRPASGAPAVVLARRDEARAAPDDRGFAPRHRPGVKRRPKGGKFNGGHSGNHVVALGDGRCVVGAGSENFKGYLYDVSGDGAAPVLATLDTESRASPGGSHGWDVACFSSAGTLAIAQRGAVVVFDAASGDKLAHTESPEYVHQWWNYSCVCVSDDGEKMCSVDEKTVRLWKSLGEGRPGDEWQAALAEPLAGDVAHGETIRRCAFEPGKWGTHTRLITAGEHELFFWAAKDLETYETAVTHRDYVESLDWTADGRLFASAGDRRRPAAATNSERFRPGKR